MSAKDFTAWFRSNWQIMVIVFAAAAGLTTNQWQLSAHADEIAEVATKAQKVEDVEGKVDDLETRLKQQAQGINWVGAAIEALAKEQGLSDALPDRPVVAED